MKNKILIFGGTTEGRILSGKLREEGIFHVVSVATEYGLQILKDSGEEQIIKGQKDAARIAELISDEHFTLVVDATHPFAATASKEIRNACAITGTEYIRLKRDTSLCPDSYQGVRFAYDLKEATELLEREEGNILLLTGSRNLKQITAGISDLSRVYVRVLPDIESLKKCELAGLKGRQIIAMQGPFSCRMNEALIRETGAGVILTKESGKTGGLDEKLKAARNCAVKAIVLRNLEEDEEDSLSFSLQEVIAHITGKSDLKSSVLAKKDRQIILAGIGPGDPSLFTTAFCHAIKKADIVFGAASVIEGLKANDIFVVPFYKGDEILEYLLNNPQFHSPVVVYSGDVSLCSGAKSAANILREAGYKVQMLNGISSVSLFASELGIGLEDAKILSAHGRKCNVKGYVMHNEHCIILPSNCEHAKEICDEIKPLTDRIIIGYELGNTVQRIMSYGDGNSEEVNLLLRDCPGRCLIYAHNANAVRLAIGSGIRDDEILRGCVPMTKEEIRALSLRKLALTGSAVFFDIGAGTGSVSVEAATLSPEIQVYAIEKKQEALALLQKNKERFGAKNMEIVKGSAPDVLRELPIPTHVFVGGNGGKLTDILFYVFKKNKKARIVINAVTVETFKEVISFIEKENDLVSDIIQVFVSRYKKVGAYHMADAINPVYIITIRKGEKSE